MPTLLNNKQISILRLPVTLLSTLWIGLPNSSFVHWCSTLLLKGNWTQFTLNTRKTSKMMPGENIKWPNILLKPVILTLNFPLATKPHCRIPIWEKCFSISITAITLQTSWKWSFMESKMLISSAKSLRASSQQSKTKTTSPTKWLNILLMKKCSKRWLKSCQSKIKELCNWHGFWAINRCIIEIHLQGTFHIFWVMKEKALSFHSWFLKASLILYLQAEQTPTIVIHNLKFMSASQIKASKTFKESLVMCFTQLRP